MCPDKSANDSARLRVNRDLVVNAFHSMKISCIVLEKRASGLLENSMATLRVAAILLIYVYKSAFQLQKCTHIFSIR